MTLVTLTKGALVEQGGESLIRTLELSVMDNTSKDISYEKKSKNGTVTKEANGAYGGLCLR